MNTKFRDVGRVNFKASARERDPMKLIQKKIAYLAGIDKSNPEVTKKYKRKVRTTVRGDQEVGIQTTRTEISPAVCQSRPADRRA